MRTRLLFAGSWQFTTILAFAAAISPNVFGQGSPKPEPACVDLAKYATAQLTDSLNSPTFVKENNLAGLPKGRQLIKNTPFQISGVLQLSGKKLKEWGRNEFPEAITNIVVGRRFSQIDLLHGAGGVYDNDGTTIGKLVLHFADDSISELPIINGQDVRDWWGEPTQAITGTNSVLAWSGVNPALRQYGGAKPGVLRVYMTKFKNPKPSLALNSIDYVSTMENSSPFLLGVTLE